MPATETSAMLPKPDQSIEGGSEPRVPSRLALARLRKPTLRGRVGRIEMVSIALVTLITVIAPFVGLLAPHGALAVVGTPFSHPTASHLLGTDDQGRDVFSRVIIGIGASWLGALAVIAIGAAIGLALGLAAGLCGGVLDAVLMRVTDAMLALPAPLVALLVAATLGPSFEHILIGVSATWWPWYARVVRGEVRSLRTRPHFEAARISGISRRRLVLRHVLPGVWGPVIVLASLDIGNVLLLLGALSFIGVGAPPPAAEIGSMAAYGLTYLFSAPWMALAPAVALFLMTLVSNLAGDGVREIFAA